MHSAPARVHPPGTAAAPQIPATACEDDSFPRIHSHYDYDVLLTQEKPSSEAPGSPREIQPNVRGNAGKALSEPGTNASRIPRPGETRNITADTGRRQPVKLQVERDPLADAVAWTARALPARPTAPVLAGMRLQAGSELTLSTFDYEVSAEATIPVAADEPGTVLVSGRRLAEIVRSLPAKPVELSTDGTRMTVRCGSATFTLMLLPAEEYPTLPGMPDVTGTVGADTFASAISQVAIAAGRDDTLPALTGIRVEIADDMLTLVATDRYRLAVRELRWTPVAPSLNTSVLIPARVLGDTARALTSGAEVAVALATAEGNSHDGIIGFEGAGRRTTTRLLAGEYPRYQTLLPSEFSAAAELPAAPFADAI